MPKSSKNKFTGDQRVAIRDALTSLGLYLATVLEIAAEEEVSSPRAEGLMRRASDALLDDVEKLARLAD